MVGILRRGNFPLKEFSKGEYFGVEQRLLSDSRFSDTLHRHRKDTVTEEDQRTLSVEQTNATEESSNLTQDWGDICKVTQLRKDWG